MGRPSSHMQELEAGKGMKGERMVGEGMVGEGLLLEA